MPDCKLGQKSGESYGAYFSFESFIHSLTFSLIHPFTLFIKWLYFQSHTDLVFLSFTQKSLLNEFLISLF